MANLAAQRWSAVLLILNLIGAARYVAVASRGWAIPGEPVTGEPYVWAISIVPVCAVFLVLNIIWGAFILARKQWRTGIVMLLSVLPIWIVAVAIDFWHH